MIVIIAGDIHENTNEGRRQARLDWRGRRRLPAIAGRRWFGRLRWVANRAAAGIRLPIPRCIWLGFLLAQTVGARAQETPTPSPEPSGLDSASQPATTDEQLLQEIEAVTTPQAAVPPAPGGQGSVPSVSRGTNNGLSNIFNPALSVNGLFLGAMTTAPDSEEASTGIRIQEVEMQFVSNVDPYFSANLVVAMDGGEGLEVEDGYLNVTPQPWNLNLRFGRLKVPFGRENYQHTHALPFIEKSLIGAAVFGEEGLGEVGAEVSYLVPLPFYSLIYGAVLNGDNENMFNSPKGRDLCYFGGLKNLFDVSDDATLEVGLSYTAGRNSDVALSQVAGAHIVYKWKPARASTTRSAVAMIEAIYAHRPAAADSESELPADTAGAYAYLQWQLAQRWFIAGRFDYLGTSLDFAEATTRESAELILAPTEFSALRLEGNVTQSPADDAPVYTALLQVNFTLGAHPAHSY